MDNHDYDHDGGNNWSEYRRLVLSEINRTIQGVAKVESSIEDLKQEMRSLNKNLEAKVDLVESKNFSLEKRMDIEAAKAKVKASIFGGIAGLIIGMVPQIIKLLSSV